MQARPYMLPAGDSPPVALSVKYVVLQGYKVASKGLRRVIGRIRVSYGQRERVSTAFRGTMLGRRMMGPNRTRHHQVNACCWSSCALNLGYYVCTQTGHMPVGPASW